MALDLSKIAGFDWDDGNARKSERRHAVTNAEAEQVFVDPRVSVAVDTAHSWNEDRFHAFGLTASGRALLVAFTLRGSGTLIRVISARDMNAKERRRYAEESEEGSQVSQ